MFLLSTSFFRLLSFVFVFVVRSFPSILLLSFVHYNENNNSARRRPFKAKKGKVRLLILFVLLFFFKPKKNRFSQIKKFRQRGGKES